MSAAPFNEVVAFEVLAAVEGHVLKEVGQSALVLILLNGTHFLGNVEVGTVLGPVVVADEIGEAVGQLTYSEYGVHRNRRVHLGEYRCSAKQHQQAQE